MLTTVPRECLCTICSSTVTTTTFQMNTTLKRKAEWVLEFLCGRLPNMSVQYHCLPGTHRFFISKGDLTYQVSCIDSVLTAVSEDDFMRVLRPIIERVLTGEKPHRVHVRTMAPSAPAAH